VHVDFDGRGLRVRIGDGCDGLLLGGMHAPPQIEYALRDDTAVLECPRHATQERGSVASETAFSRE
jgi:hypothetical protein